MHDGVKFKIKAELIQQHTPAKALAGGYDAKTQKVIYQINGTPADGTMG